MVWDRRKLLTGRQKASQEVRRDAGKIHEVRGGIDRWRYFDITHRDHAVMNPLGQAKVHELVDLLGPMNGGRLLDIACGKGEILVRLVERYGMSAVGIDLSPYFAAEARRRVAERVPGAEVTIVEGDGADYGEKSVASFDLTLCLGATWVYGSFHGTLQALARFTRPGGQIAVGHPYWRREPPPEYLAASGDTRESFGTHLDNVDTAELTGLRLMSTLVSSDDDWDQYESMHWRATERFAAAHPDDPIVPELLAENHRHRDAYLRWGRDVLGWAVYALLKPR